MTMRETKGSSLVSVLLVAGLCGLLAFTVAGVSISHLGVANRLENAQTARQIAEATSHHLIARVCEDDRFGARPDASGFLPHGEIQLNGGTGRFSFDARRLDVPQSLNNLHNNRSVAGWRRTLPGYSLQIVTQGNFRNQSRLLETIVTIPPYPNAIATSGKLVSNGGLTVLGVDDMNDLLLGLDNIPPDRIKAGHVASNSPKTDADDPAMVLQAQSASPSRITGDAKAVGSLVCDPSYVTIEGSPRGGCEPAPLPTLNFDSYDPELMGNGFERLARARFDSGVNVTSAIRRSGDLTIRGGLHLDNGYLYVDGNLHIEGGIHGKGMVIGTHNVTVEGSSAMNATSAIGLMSKGDLELRGQATGQSTMDNSTFRGVVYTEGDLRASNIQLVGSLLGNKPDGEGSQMELNNVNVIHQPAAIDVTWNNGWQPVLATPDPYWSRAAEWAEAAGLNPDDFRPTEVVFNNHMFPLGDLRYTAEQIERLAAGDKLPAGVPQQRTADGNLRTVFTSDPALLQTEPGPRGGYPPLFPFEAGARGGDALGLRPTAGVSEDPLLMETPWARLVQTQVERQRASPVEHERWWINPLPGPGIENTDLGTNGPQQFLWGFRTASGRVFSSPCDFFMFVSEHAALRSHPDFAQWMQLGPGTTHDNLVDDYNQLAFRQIAEYDRNYQQYLTDLDRARGVLDGGVSLDPNRFIQFQDKMRRVLVREVPL